MGPTAFLWQELPCRIWSFIINFYEIKFPDRGAFAMTSLCYMNETFGDEAGASLPVSDLAIQRGIGVFDTVRTYDRRPFALAAHMERLAASAAGCRIRLPLAEEEMASIIREGASRIPGDSLAKAFITAGDSEEDGCFPKSRFFALFSPLKKTPDEVYSRGVALSLLPEERMLPLVKSINYMIPFSRKVPGTFEPLYCPGGEITESATSSFFAVVKGVLVTAPDHRVLRGITREILIDVARNHGLKVEFRCLPLSELSEASEAFVTGSVKEIAPVVRIGDAVIGTGLPGPVTLRLLHLFRRELQRHLE